MSILLKNALLADIDPTRIELADLRLFEGYITDRGTLSPLPDEEVIDCEGALVLPGLVNGHTHLYSALAVGMPPPSDPPVNFLEILERVWWRLDRALDPESIELSATVGALAALRSGTTTLVDHHASPTVIAGSLDLVEDGIEHVGLRAVLCYETTDRHGKAGARAGLTENDRYLSKCAARKESRFAALVGAHASFTLEDDTLHALRALARQHRAGIHIHVAEDPCDEQLTQSRFGCSLLARFERHDLFHRDNLFAHGLHLAEPILARMGDARLTLAHNPRSNMNNAVGYAPLPKVRNPVLLGTDGIGGDMLAELQAAWFKARDAHASRTPDHLLAMLASSARLASQRLGISLGKLHPGAAADVVITRYFPYTPLTADNLGGHLLFGLSSRHVRHVLVEGTWALRDGHPIHCDPRSLLAKAEAVTRSLWERMQQLHA